MKGPFSALRPYTEKYPVRSYIVLIGFFFLVEAIVRKEDLFSQGLMSAEVGEVLFMSVFFAAGFFIFIRYVTRFISAGRD